MTASPVTISFQAKPFLLKNHMILAVPKDESVKLPSRGQISVMGTMNGQRFRTVLEPDGRWSHWMRINEELRKVSGVQVGQTVTVEMTTNATWPEPNLPDDFLSALDSSPHIVKDKWKDITPMARWEWIRWMNATLSQETRAIRIGKTISKLQGKHRRPCCFNLAACTDPELSKSGLLIEPNEARV